MDGGDVAPPSWALDLTDATSINTIIGVSRQMCRTGSQCLSMYSSTEINDYDINTNVDYRNSKYGVKQSVPTVDGTKYQLSLWTDNVRLLHIIVNGATLQNSPTASTIGVYSQFLATFTAVGTSTAISILNDNYFATSVGSSGTLVSIDDVLLAAYL